MLNSRAAATEPDETKVQGLYLFKDLWTCRIGFAESGDLIGAQINNPVCKTRAEVHENFTSAGEITKQI